MIRSCCTALAALFLLFASGLRAQALQLVSGDLLLAKVEEATGDGLRVTRLDNGGVLDLRWDHLTPECALRVKKQFALAGEEQTELTVTVQELRYNKDGSVQTVIGKVVDKTAPTLVVQVKGTQFLVPRNDINQIRDVEVPVAQVFTKDEYYNLSLQELVPGDKDKDADLHKLLGERLMKVRDYAHALDHLQKAKELGNSKEPARVEELLQKLKLYQESQKERDLLDLIQVARVRGTQVDFEQGTKLIAQFEKDYALSKLKTDFEAEKKRFAEARKAFYCNAVAQAWRGAIGTLAEKKQLEAGITIDAAKQYADQKMTDEIAAVVAARFKIDLAEVKTFWGEREKYSKGKLAEHFSYGIGSWLLGEQAILKDTKAGKDQQKAPEDAAQKDQLERLTKALREAMERRRAQNQQGGQGQPEQTPDQWWQSASRPERINWLRAYYAENSGQLKVTYASVTPCVPCSGMGTVSELVPSPDGQGSKIAKVKCYLCHGMKWMRSFKAW